MESELCIIRTGIYTLSGYSAHAGQQDLHKFVSSIESAGTNTSGAWRNSGKTNIKKSSWGCINHVINLSMY
ncbi:MBL fold metallo-hydrolase RNA specificity domain-containing protein [Pseudomonas deceptionensis]|uniref:MBL fold metallo-hydrolase RNA specificity domain-containing protein n=1 Tax=Pseudomonas deceptionensis TaxID=882211 RepID=UPI003B97E9A6